MCYVIVTIFIFVTSIAKKSFFKLDKIEEIEQVLIKIGVCCKHALFHLNDDF